MNFHEFKSFVHEKALSRETGLLGRIFRWVDSLSSDYANIQAVGLKSIDKLSFYESVRNDLFKSHEVSA
jgi:hypothetical protein